MRLSIFTDKVINKMSMRDGGRVNMLKILMASIQEMIEGRVAGISYCTTKESQKIREKVDRDPGLL